MQGCGTFEENDVIGEVWGCSALIRELGLKEVAQYPGIKSKHDRITKGIRPEPINYTPNPVIVEVCI